MNKFCFFSLLLLVSSNNHIYSMDVPAYLRDDMEQLPGDATYVQFAKEPDSFEFPEKPTTRYSTLIESSMNSVAQNLEDGLKAVNESNKDVLIDLTIQKVRCLPKELRIPLKELFLNRCSQKIFFDFYTAIQNSHQSSMSGEHIEFLGTKFYVTKELDGCIEIIADTKNLAHEQEWRVLSWLSLIDRYCTVLIAQKNGYDYPQEFRDENPLFYEGQ